MRKVVFIAALGAVGYWLYTASQQSNDVSSTNGEGASLLDAFNPFLDVAYSVGGAVGMGLGMQISLNGLNMIKNREKLRLRPYNDGYGFMTIGYGHKILPLESFGDITESEAVQILVKDLSIAENGVNSLVTVPISQNKYDALVSFVFNAGVGAFKRSDMLKYINSGNFAAALNEFPKWKFSAGKVSKGLINRRAEESALFAYA